MGLFVFVMDEGMNPKELHQHFLENSPFKEDIVLNKKERLAKGLPPNKFNEHAAISKAIGLKSPSKLMLAKPPKLTQAR